MAISWVRGDKPLPLRVNMDLSDPDVTVSVLLRDTGNPDAGVLFLTPTIVDAAGGRLTVTGEALDAAARYELQTKVYRGSDLVATFPNDGLREILHVRPNLAGSGTVPEGVTILDGGAP